MVFGLEVGMMEGMEGDVDLRGTRRGFASGDVGWPSGDEESISVSRSISWVRAPGSAGLVVGIPVGREKPLWHNEGIVELLAEYSNAVGAEIAVRMLRWEVGVEKAVWTLELGRNDGSSKEETGASMDSFVLCPVSATTA
jgi:hypothetical protein